MPLASRLHEQRCLSRPKRRYLVAYHCLMTQNLPPPSGPCEEFYDLNRLAKRKSFPQEGILRQGRAHLGAVHGHSQQRSQISNDGRHSQQRYIARDEGQKVASPARLQVSLASAKSSRQTGCRTPSSPCLHFRSWLFLAPASGLQIRYDPKDPRGFLADEIRPKCKA